jgi:predicted oxidoreductase
VEAVHVLGTTGVKVSPLCLGAGGFGAWGNRDHDDAARVIHRALDAGINFIDTADVYSAGESEQIVGKALEGRRENVVLATKANGPMGDDHNQKGNSRRWLIRECENSLRRLNTCACRKPRPRHATRRYSLIRPPTRACFRTRYWSRSIGSGSDFSGAAASSER